MDVEFVLRSRDIDGLIDRVARQLPFAGSLALNRAANEFQAAERAHMGKVFTVRRPWVLQGVKINRADRASKTNLRARIHIDPARGFLTKFEEGGEKKPRDGRSIAIPERTRFPRAKVVPKGKRPKAYQFQTHVTATGKTQIKGTHRTFILATPQGRGVFQRFGRGRRTKIRLLFFLAPRAQIRGDLDFVDNARKVMRDRFPILLKQAIGEAMKSARKTSPSSPNPAMQFPFAPIGPGQLPSSGLAGL